MLREYWFQLYVRDHWRELGFDSLIGPFEVGPDFKGVYRGREVKVEVERDYKAFLHDKKALSSHQGIDVLIVGVGEDPPAEIRSELPPFVINLDPQTVAEYTRPLRAAYRLTKAQEGERRREKLREFTQSIKQRALMSTCDCGGELMQVSGNDPELIGELSEGQWADYLAGFWTAFRCRKCGSKIWVENADGGDGID